MIAEMFLSESVALFSPQATEFWIELLTKLRHGYPDYQFNNQDREEHISRVPPELCIELMRTFSPTKLQLGPHQVYDHACDLLSALSSVIPFEFRKEL